MDDQKIRMCDIKQKFQIATDSKYKNKKCKYEKEKRRE